MTNAAWIHNWMMHVMFWDPVWESKFNGQYLQGIPAPPVFSQGYEALVFRPEGGYYYFNSTNGQPVLTDPQSQVTLQPLSGIGYPLATNHPSFDGNNIYW